MSEIRTGGPVPVPATTYGLGYNRPRLLPAEQTGRLHRAFGILLCPLESATIRTIPSVSCPAGNFRSGSYRRAIYFLSSQHHIILGVICVAIARHTQEDHPILPQTCSLKLNLMNLLHVMASDCMNAHATGNLPPKQCFRNWVLGYFDYCFQNVLHLLRLQLLSSCRNRQNDDLDMTEAAWSGSAKLSDVTVFREMYIHVDIFPPSIVDLSEARACFVQLQPVRAAAASRAGCRWMSTSCSVPKNGYPSVAAPINFWRATWSS